MKKKSEVIQEAFFGYDVNPCLKHIVAPRTPKGGLSSPRLARLHDEKSLKRYSHQPEGCAVYLLMSFDCFPRLLF